MVPGTRIPLQHIPPSFVADGSWFFITLCCQQRGRNQLCLPNVSSMLLADGVFYHARQRWALHLLLLMPDHVHLIAGFPKAESMSEVMRSWKRLSARRAGLDWQRNYFDHRVRPDEGLELKTDYIRQNPVRAGLVKSAEEWPHCVDYRTLQGRWGQRPLPQIQEHR
jgi:REP element-mobilizing transposase RayT